MDIHTKNKDLFAIYKFMTFIKSSFYQNSSMYLWYIEESVLNQTQPCRTQLH